MAPMLTLCPHTTTPISSPCFTLCGSFIFSYCKHVFFVRRGIWLCHWEGKDSVSSINVRCKSPREGFWLACLGHMLKSGPIIKVTGVGFCDWPIWVMCWGGWWWGQLFSKGRCCSSRQSNNHLVLQSLSLSLSLSLSPLPGTSLRFLIPGRTLDECSCLSSPRCVAPWLLWRSSWEVRRPRSLVVGFLRPQALPPTPRKRQMTWTIPASMPPTPWGLHPGLRLPPRLRWPQMKKACCWPVEQWTLTPPRRPVPLQSLPRMVSVASRCLYMVMMYFNSACHFFLFSRIHTLIWLFSCPPASWLDEESPPPPSPSPDVQSLTHASLLT